MRTHRPSILTLAALLALSSGNCRSAPVTFERIAPGTPHVRRHSFVVLFGKDPVAPESPPESCKQVATARFRASGEKTYHFSKLRRAVQDLGANGASNITLVKRDGHTFHYTANVLQCAAGLFSTSRTP